MKKEWTFFDQPKNIRILKQIFYGVLALLVLFDFLIDRHPHFPWEGIFGFHAVYGFLACVAIVFFSNGLGRWLKRKEDFYD